MNAVVQEFQNFAQDDGLNFVGPKFASACKAPTENLPQFVAHMSCFFRAARQPTAGAVGSEHVIDMLSHAHRFGGSFQLAALDKDSQNRRAGLGFLMEHFSGDQSGDFES